MATSALHEPFVPRGSHCLEAAQAGGSIVNWMDDRVGLDVCVDAVDLSTDYLEALPPHVCVVTGDVEEAEIVDGYAGCSRPLLGPMLPVGRSCLRCLIRNTTSLYPRPKSCGSRPVDLTCQLRRPPKIFWLDPLFCADHAGRGLADFHSVTCERGLVPNQSW